MSSSQHCDWFIGLRLVVRSRCLLIQDVIGYAMAFSLEYKIVTFETHLEFYYASPAIFNLKTSCKNKKVWHQKASLA
jgi:hypothetical protein